jgi:hypothetical protein
VIENQEAAIQACGPGIMQLVTFFAPLTTLRACLKAAGETQMHSAPKDVLSIRRTELRKLSNESHK